MLLSRIKTYFQLTKPTIMLLVVFSAAVSLFIQGSLLKVPHKFILALLAVYLTGGAANTFNQYFERETDAKMSRTKLKRPLPQNRISPEHAFLFALLIGTVGVLILWFVFNWLSAVMSLFTILFYSFFYTLWLKPSTPQNIVIGGIAGSMAPVGVWAAVTGNVGLDAVLLFLILFFWTPPHFWSLALFCKDDYIKANLPMLPIVKGDAETVRQILIYTFVLTAVSLAPVMIGSSGWFYGSIAALLGGVFLKKAWELKKLMTVPAMRSVFGYSIVYLFALLSTMVIDKLAVPKVLAFLSFKF